MPPTIITSIPFSNFLRTTSITESSMPAIDISHSEDIPRSPVDGKPTIVYWNIVCYAHAIRLALAYAGVDFVDVRIDPGDPSSGRYKQAWFDVKTELEELLVFPNVPYFLDSNGVSISQSNTILRHIGRTYFPASITNEQHRTIDLILDELKDQENSMTAAAYASKEALHSWYEESLPGVLRRFSRLFADRMFLLGSCDPSIADFKLYQFLYRLPGVKYIPPPAKNDTECYRNTPLSPPLIDFMSRIEAFPKVQAYMHSADFLPHPLHSPHASFIGIHKVS